MAPVYEEFIPAPPENQLTTEVCQYDLLGALQAKLCHSNLIRNIWLMPWNLESNLNKLFFADGSTSLH